MSSSRQHPPSKTKTMKAPDGSRIAPPLLRRGPISACESSSGYRKRSRRHSSGVVAKKKIKAIIAKDDSRISSLPSQIIFEILLRLPATSVVMCRCVSKLFNQLSTTKEFISAHTRKWQNNPQLLPTSLAFFALSSKPTAVYILYGRTKHNIKTIGLDDILPFLPRRNYDIVLAASSDGLLCFNFQILRRLVMTTSFIISNPLTKSYSLISLPVRDAFEVLSFYYHEHSNTYKLLLMRHAECSVYCMQYEVFTVGLNTLTTIENSTPYDANYYERQLPPKLIGNIWYCLASRRGIRGSYAALLVFNIETEQFTHVSLPDDTFSNEETIELLEIDGKLCICKFHFSDERLEFQVELWILKDQLEGIWIKKQKVYVEILQGQEENYNVVAAVCNEYCLCYHVLLVKSESNNDITSPEEAFTFFSFDDERVIESNPGLVYVAGFTFREALTSVTMHLQCDEAIYPPHQHKR